MKKIFTLLFCVMATLSAMAGTSFKVTNPMSVVDNTQEECVFMDQTVELIQNDDETWSLKFYEFQSDKYFIGDITFDGITVKDLGYYVYSLQCNEATGKVTDETSPYYGKTLVLQLVGQLSPKGYGEQAFTFEMFCDEDEDCFFSGYFSPDAGSVDGIIAPVYFKGTSASGAVNSGEAILGVLNEEDGSVTFAIEGLLNVKSDEEYSDISIKGLEMMPAEDMDGVYTLKAENVTATDEDNTSYTVKSLEVTLVSNAGPAVGDDDMGDDDMGFGGDDDMGTGGDEMEEWTISGKLVFVDPTTSEEFTYEISSDEEILASVKGVNASANSAAEYFSLNGAKLSGAAKGINIVRINGKTVKALVK